MSISGFDPGSIFKTPEAPPPPEAPPAPVEQAPTPAAPAAAPAIANDKFSGGVEFGLDPGALEFEPLEATVPSAGEGVTAPRPADAPGLTAGDAPGAAKEPNAATTLTDKSGKPVDLAGKAKEIEGMDDEATKARAQLNEDLSRFGDALTPEQRAEYEQQFKAKNPVIDQAKAEKAKLATYLMAHQTDLIKEADAEQPAGSKSAELVKAYAALMPDQSAAAMDFVTQTLRDPQAAKNGLAGQVISDLVADNVAAFQGDMLKEHNGDIAAATDSLNHKLGDALEAYKENVKPYQNKGKEYQKSAKEATELAGFLGEMNTAVAEGVRDGNVTKRLASLAVKAEKEGSTGSVSGKALGGVALVLGLAGAKGAADDGDYLKAVQGLSGSVEGGAKMLQSFNVISSKLAGGGVLNAARVAPFFGAVTAGLQTASDWKQYKKSGDKLQLGVLAGDAMTLVGAGAGLFAATAGLAAPFAAAGGLAIFTFKALQEDKEHREVRQHTREILHDLHPPITGQLADALETVGPYKLDQLKHDYGLSPDTIARMLQSPADNVGVLNLPDLSVPANQRAARYVQSMFKGPDGQVDQARLEAYLNDQAQAAGQANRPGFKANNSSNALMQYLPSSYTPEMAHMTPNSTPEQWAKALQAERDYLAKAAMPLSGVSGEDERQVLLAQMDAAIAFTQRK